MSANSVDTSSRLSTVSVKPHGPVGGVTLAFSQLLQPSSALPMLNSIAVRGHTACPLPEPAALLLESADASWSCVMATGSNSADNGPAVGDGVNGSAVGVPVGRAVILTKTLD